jgi:hypothetical protein
MDCERVVILYPMKADAKEVAGHTKEVHREFTGEKVFEGTFNR